MSKDVWSRSRPAGGAVSVVGVVLSLSHVLVIFLKSMIVRWTTNIMLHAMWFQCITALKTFVLVHFMCTGYILVYKVFKCSGRCILKKKKNASIVSNTIHFSVALWDNPTSHQCSGATLTFCLNKACEDTSPPPRIKHRTSGKTGGVCNNLQKLVRFNLTWMHIDVL